MAKHSTPLGRALLRAAVTVSSAAALASAGAAAAHAETGASDGRTVGEAILGTAKYLPVNPLAGTSVNPLDNSVGTTVNDGPPVSTALVTAPAASSRQARDLPLFDDAYRVLGGR